MRLFTPLGLLLLAAQPVLAQCGNCEAQPAGSMSQTISSADEAANQKAIEKCLERTRRIRQTVRLRTIDGQLSAEDFRLAFKAAGGTVNPCEMGALRQALAGELGTYEVSAEARDEALKLIYTANLFDDSKTVLDTGKTYHGVAIPDAVRELVVRAKLNGAIAYDVTEKTKDGEGKYSHYPAVTPATENMAFAYTAITPATLQADMDDTATHLRITGTETVDLGTSTVEVGRYTEQKGGSGSIDAAYDEAFHPVMELAPSVLATLGYPTDLDPIAVGEARSRSGNKWSSNCAILSDGTVHCLPAVRRHSANRGLILTNPSLSRGQQLLWNGHINVRNGVVTYMGTSGGIAKRAAEGKDRFIDPIPLLKAWGFKIAPGLEIVSEHASARPRVDGERAIQYANPAQVED